MILGLRFRGTYELQFLERELSEGTRSNGFDRDADGMGCES
jgi:hypothetical protein